VAGLATAADDIERLGEPAHTPGESRSGDGILKRTVLEQGEECQDRVASADHREVNAERDPQALGVAERSGYLAEADRGGGVAHEVEGVKEAQRRGALAVRIDAGG
jgi:hypothetical protein